MYVHVCRGGGGGGVMILRDHSTCLLVNMVIVHPYTHAKVSGGIWT